MDNKYTPFYEIKEKQQKTKLYDEILPALPIFCVPFFKELDRLEGKSYSSLIGYASDIKIYLKWIKDSFEEYQDIPIEKLNIDSLCRPKISDVKSFFLDYLPEYPDEYHMERAREKGMKSEHITLANSKTTAARKLATLKRFYHYFLNLESENPYHIEHDPVSAIKQQKDKRKPIKIIDGDQIAKIIDGIESPDRLFGNRKTKREAWTKRQAIRDIAINTLLAGTGMRVSELVGLNLQDIDFDTDTVHLHRKGGKNDTVYLSEETKAVLLDYINNSRKQDYQPSDEENALFLSRKHTRISISAVERMVIKYTQEVIGEKGYTPHKYRSSFATRALKSGNSIKTVQSALSHSDPTVLIKYYQQENEEEKKEAFKNFDIRS